jgi:hypothetical protein
MFPIKAFDYFSTTILVANDTFNYKMFLQLLKKKNLTLNQPQHTIENNIHMSPWD